MKDSIDILIACIKCRKYGHHVTKCEKEEKAKKEKDKKRSHIAIYSSFNLNSTIKVSYFQSKVSCKKRLLQIPELAKLIPTFNSPLYDHQYESTEWTSNPSDTFWKISRTAPKHLIFLF